MKACKIDGCPKPAGVPGTAHGWCSMHYTRWKRAGDPLTTLTDLKPKPSPICAIPGCDAPRWARGYCGTHYHRLRTTGQAGGAERMTEPPIGSCAVGGCARAVKSKRLCGRHYQRLIKYGDPLAGGTEFGLHERCEAESCGRPHYARGLCHAHWRVITSTYRRGDRLGISVPGKCTPEQLVARIEYFANRCWMCGGKADGIDHVKPISKGGSNWPSNLRPACAPCNTKKHARWPFQLESEGAA